MEMKKGTSHQEVQVVDRLVKHLDTLDEEYNLAEEKQEHRILVQAATALIHIEDWTQGVRILAMEHNHYLQCKTSDMHSDYVHKFHHLIVHKGHFDNTRR